MPEHFFYLGTVLMLTTPEDPYQSLYKLRHRKSKFQNIMYGRFKLVGSTVIAVVKKLNSESAASSALNCNRYRRIRQVNNVQEMQEQTFHLVSFIYAFLREIYIHLFILCMCLTMPSTKILSTYSKNILAGT